LLERPLPWILAVIGLALAPISCHRPAPPPERQGPSEAFGRYQRLQREAKALLDQTKRGLEAETAEESADRIEQRLVELEPRVAKLPKAERPHARRLVDQTLALLDGIRAALQEREQAAP